MENSTRIITAQALDGLFTKWRAAGKRILAPKKIGDKVDFADVKNLAEVSLDQVQTVQSPKLAVFPRVEELLAFQRREGRVKICERDLAVLPETVIFGLRPCDAAALTSLQAILNWDSVDKLFSARLEKMIVVAVSCARADEYCFCTSVNGGPGSLTGSDILLTALGAEEFLAETVSAKGGNLVHDAAELFQEASGRKKEKESRLAKVEPVFAAERIASALAAVFDEPSFWEEQSRRCLGCGACAYVCPTCACFDIQDEGGASGKRLRCWDSCGFGLFTLHTSGHNPRPLQSQRWRQRLMHKFAYMPERQFILGCVGCGRCSRACPVDMNILEHLRGVAEAKS